MENYKNLVEANYNDFLEIFKNNNKECAIVIIIDFETEQVHVSSIHKDKAPSSVRYQMMKANSQREAFIVLLLDKNPEKDEDYENATYFAFPVNPEA